MTEQGRFRSPAADLCPRAAGGPGRVGRRAVGACLSVVVLACLACAHTTGRGQAGTAEGLYALASEELEGGLLPEAQKDFEDLRAQYPYSRFAALAELRGADVLLKRGQALEAIEGYRQFLQLHPNHSLADYALLQVAEGYHQQLPGEWWLMPPQREKDQGATGHAIEAYQQMLARFPTGPSSDLARERLLDCRRRLADHELYVAQFYLRHSQPAGARRRAQGLLDTYPGLGLDADALWIIVQAAHQTGDQPAAQAASARLQEEFGGSPAAARLRRLGPLTAPAAP